MLDHQVEMDMDTAYHFNILCQRKVVVPPHDNNSPPPASAFITSYLHPQDTHEHTEDQQHLADVSVKMTVNMDSQNFTGLTRLLLEDISAASFEDTTAPTHIELEASTTQSEESGGKKKTRKVTVMSVNIFNYNHWERRKEVVHTAHTHQACTHSQIQWSCTHTRARSSSSSQTLV